MLSKLDRTIKPLWSPRRLVALALMLGVLLGADVLLGAWTLHVSHQSCVQVQIIQRTIQQAGRRNLATLGKPGGVAYAYYAAHPAELRKAKAELRLQINEFTPLQCSGPF